MNSFSTFLKLTLVAGGFLLLQPAVAQTYSWSQMPTPNPSPERNLLRGISGTSPTDVWAVGDYQTSPPGLVQYTQTHLIMHWNGTSWTSYPVQDFSSPSNYSSFWDVEAIAPNNAWAVGIYSGPGSGSQTQVAHWDGSSWTNTAVNLSTGTSYLWSVDAISASDIWAVGGKAGININPCFAYHYDGTSWTDVPVPPVGQRRNRFIAVDGISANDVWAVGSWGHTAGSFNHLAMHWDGSTWTNYPMPASISGLGGELLDVKMVSANDVWAVGDVVTGGIVMLHWDGTSWSQVATTGGGGAFAVLDTDDIYAVGGEIMHWNGSTWTEVDSLANQPYPALRAATVLPNGEVWAAGRTIDFSDKFYTLVYRYSSNNPQLTVSTSSPTIQPGASVQLLAQPTTPGSYTYRWSAIGGNSVFSDSTSASPTVSPDATTTYAVNMTNAAGQSVQGLVKVEVSGTVSATTELPVTEVTAWPNPFTDKVQLSFTAREPQNVQFIITDALGRTVSNTSAQVQKGRQQLLLQLPGQAAGVYVLHLKTTTGVWQTKLVKQ